LVLNNDRSRVKQTTWIKPNSAGDWGNVGVHLNLDAGPSQKRLGLGTLGTDLRLKVESTKITEIRGVMGGFVNFFDTSVGYTTR